ncbi:COG4949 Uncharacterized membrane-anchored protein conserved in bacteria [Oxalobacteraceae bacterium]|jgi:uncharacterized membrane-anchored protein|nr:DUF3422 domain-containing protein [Oxalobacteraceae bacterium]
MSIVYSTLNHPLRVPLAAEIHSRPPVRLEAPEAITHLAVHGRNEPRAPGDRLGMQSALLADFCARFGVPAPAGNAKYFFHDFGRFRLKWECHTEFASFTVVNATSSPLAGATPFARMPSSELPEDWLLSLQGRLLVATHILLDNATASAEDLAPQMRQLFDTNAIVGSGASQAAQVWTDFRIHADGFARFVVLDAGLKGMQAGRLVQRLLEIETYRVMALLGLPMAQQAAPVLNDIEAELASVTREMVASHKPGRSEEEGMQDEQDLLQQITLLASRLEQLSVDDSYRFSASQAYFGLVMARIHELREQRVEGVPTIEEFMQRRLTPAMNTCTATAHRQEVLAERIANTNSLLRTRVGIRQERQNSQILESMNTRAAQQLRLQQAVEGLSVAAISYYLVGLLGYLLKGAKAAGLPVNTDLATGVAVPVLAVVVWMGLRALRRKFQSPAR